MNQSFVAMMPTSKVMILKFKLMKGMKLMAKEIMQMRAQARKMPRNKMMKMQMNILMVAGFRLLKLTMAFSKYVINAIMIILLQRLTQKLSRSKTKKFLKYKMTNLLIQLFVALQTTKLQFQLAVNVMIVNAMSVNVVIMIQIMDVMFKDQAANNNDLKITIIINQPISHYFSFANLLFIIFPIKQKKSITNIFMIISYNWQIIDNLNLPLQQLQAYIKLPQTYEQQTYNQDSNNVTFKHIHLRKPYFGFLFTYLIQQPKINIPQIQLIPQLMMFDEAVRFKVVKEIKNKNYIYLEIMVDNFQLYDNLMVLTVKIKYHREKKLEKVSTMEELIRLAGNRQINMHTATTYATIRKEIIIESPISIQHKQYKEGYLIVKFYKSQEYNDQVEILEVELLNLVSTGNENLKKQIIEKLVHCPFRLKSKETFALAYKIQQSLKNVQMPISIIYRLCTDNVGFKMIKTLKSQQGKS